MDTFTLAVFLLIIIIAINQKVFWAAMGIGLLLVVSLRSMGLMLLTAIGLLIVIMLRSTSPFWGVAMAVLVITIFIVSRKGAASPYGPEMLMG